MNKWRVLSITSCLITSLAIAACQANVETVTPQTVVQTPPETPTTTPEAAAPPSQPAAPPPNEARKQLPNSIAYYMDGMEKAKVTENIIYKTLPDGENLRLDVYLPEEAEKDDKYPVVILVHGKARNPVNLKSRGMYVTWSQLIAKSGMAAVAFNYRLSTFDRTSEATEDIRDLIEYVRENADTLQIDKDRLAIATYSASGVAGLYFPLKERPPFIKAMVSYYNWLDLEHMRPYNEPNVFDKLNEFAPITHLQHEPEKLAPMLVLKAGKDSDQINDSIDRFMKLAEEKKADVRMLVHPEGDHGFDFENDDDTSRELIKQTIDFLTRNLKEK